MKKIIGILGVVVIAVAMFFSANSLNSSSSDIRLAGLMTMNTANAENNADIFNPTVLDCIVTEPDGNGGYKFHPGQELQCYGGFTSCVGVPCLKNVEVR